MQHLAIVVTAIVLVVCAGKATAQDHKPWMGYFAGQLVDGLEDALVSSDQPEFSAEAVDSIIRILDENGVLDWTQSHPSSYVLVPGGSAVFNSAAGFEGSLRNLDDAQRDLAQQALNALFVADDHDAAVELLTRLAGSNASPPDRMSARLTETVDGARRQMRSYASEPGGAQFEIAGPPQSVTLSWDVAASSATLTIENPLATGPPGQRFEVTAPVSLGLYDNPVHLTPLILTEQREFRFSDGSGAGSSVARNTEQPVTITPPMRQVILLQNQLTELSCDATLWENTQTGVLNCGSDESAPDGPHRRIGPGNNRPEIASVIGPQIQPSIDLLLESMSEQERAFFEDAGGSSEASETTAQAVASCADRQSEFEVSGAILTSSAGSGMLTFACGPVQSFGGEIQVNVALPIDVYEISQRRLELHVAAKGTRGGGVIPGYRALQVDLDAPATQVSLGTLAPGYYRVTVLGELTNDLLADAWLLLTVDQKPGILRQTESDLPQGQAEVMFDAPPMAGDPDDPSAPRYAIDVVQIGRDGLPRRRATGNQPTHDFEAAPGKPLLLDTFFVSPGTNLVHLLVRSGNRRFIIDTLNIEIEQPPPAPLHFTLNGNDRLIDQDLTAQAGSLLDIEFGGLAVPFGSSATVRLHRLTEFDPDRPSTHQFQPAYTSDAPLGRIVEELPVRNLKQLNAWTLGSTFEPGRYAVGIDLDQTGQTWYLYLTIEAPAPDLLELAESYQLGQPVPLPATFPATITEPGQNTRYRAFRLGHHVPGCALERQQELDVRDNTFAPDLPGVYLVRLSRSTSGDSEATLDQAAFEVLSDPNAASWGSSRSASPQPVNADDRLHAARNPWSHNPQAGDDCAAAGITSEDIKLQLVAYSDDGFVDVDGPAQYGIPYYLEGRLEAPARKLSYRANFARPDGTRQTVRLYRLEDDATRLRSDILYFVWDHYAEIANAVD